MKSTISKMLIVAAAAAASSTIARAEDISYPSDGVMTFSNGTEYTEVGDEWGEKHESAETSLKVSVTGAGNTITGINKEANPWRNVTLTGAGYLTMIRNGQWSIGLSDNPGSTKDFEGTLHIQHLNYCQTYFGIDSNKLSFEKGSIVLEAGSGNYVYFSNYAPERKIGDLSTAGDHPERITVEKKNNGTLYIGYLNKNSTFGGRFVNSGSTPFDIVKVGTGTWTLNGEVDITNGTFTVESGAVVFDCAVSNSVAVGASGMIGGTGTIGGAVVATSGAKLLFDADNVLTFTGDADLSGFIVDATGCTAGNEYPVAKGTSSLPGVSAEHSALGWMTEARDGNVYLVNRMTVISANVTLDADADWSATPVTVADNVTIDLNGHSLSVAGITFGTGVTFVNNGAEKSRLYAGINGADKSWLLGLNLAANIMPVFVGAAIEIPQTFVPAGGIGFKNTSGEQYLYNASCNNGLAFLGGGKIIEQWKDWNFGAGKTCTVTVEGDDNTFTFNDDNWSTEPGAFTTTPFVGSGTLTIVSSASGMPAAPVVGAKGLGNSGFSGRIILKPAANYSSGNGYGIKFEDDNNIADGLSNGSVSLLWDGEGKVHFSLRSQNGGTPPTYNIGNLITEGSHPENIVLSAQIAPAYAVIKTGWDNADGAFAGTVTNFNKETEKPINIEKHGTGTWKLTGTIANGGTFTVAAGGVEFCNGLANVTSLTVASGASALFAGDMGSNPISLASGSTLKLDASNEGDDVPVVNGNLDLTGVSIYVSQGTYVPSKTEPRELLRVAGMLTGFDRNDVTTDIDVDGWAFRVVDNGDGTKSIVHKRRIGMGVIIR